MNTLRKLIVLTLLGVWSFPAVGLAKPMSEAGTPAESTRALGAAPATTERSEGSTSEADDLQAREKQAPELQEFRGGAAIYIGGAALVLLIVLLVILLSARSYPPLRKSLRRVVAARARSGPPALTRCRLVAMNASRPCSSQGRGNRTEPRREQLGITSQQRETEAEGHIFVVVRRPPDAVGRGELRGRVLLHPGPRHPGRVDEGHVGAELVEHLNLGDGGLVADVHDATLEERVHEGGLPHVGDAEDHHAQRLVGPAAVGSQRATGGQDAIDLARFLRAQGEALHARLGVVVLQPAPRLLRIGHVRFVEQLERGLLPPRGAAPRRSGCSWTAGRGRRAPR